MTHLCDSCANTFDCYTYKNFIVPLYAESEVSIMVYECEYYANELEVAEDEDE